MQFNRRSIHAFFGFYGLCLMVQLVGGWFTRTSVGSWYPTLEKSPLTPPGYMFGIVWTILYALMALAATRIYLVQPRLKSRMLAWWLIQLILGLIWSIIFFGNRAIDGGLYIISALDVAVVTTIILFWHRDSRAAILMLPLLFWLVLATHLNLYIYLHNP